MARLVYAVPVVLVSIVLIGCTGEDQKTAEIASPTDRESSGTDFEAYLKLKGIPPAPGGRRDRALATFRERTAIAKAILEEALIDKAAISAEVLDFRNELLIRRYFEAFLSQKVTDEAVRAHYQNSIEKYTKHKVKLAWIRFPVDVTMRTSAKATKLARVREVHKQLQGGAAFPALVRQYSEDKTTAGNNGVVGWVEEAQIDKMVFQKALAMKKGEVSEPITAPSGYYIVQLLEDPVAEPLPLEEVQKQIQYQLRHAAKQAEMKRLLEKGKQ